MAASLAKRVLGTGPAVMFVHGEVGPGPTWKTQEALSARWQVVIVTRRGFRMSPAAERQDFEADAEDLSRLLEREPAHCVGCAYGAVGLAVTAGRDPALVRSLTLIEPPLHQPAPGGEELLADGLRPPWEAEPDLEAVAAAGVPALVMSGEHDPALDVACDTVAERLGAGRERLPGAGAAVQRADGFNARLERFLFGAER